MPAGSEYLAPIRAALRDGVGTDEGVEAWSDDDAGRSPERRPSWQRRRTAGSTYRKVRRERIDAADDEEGRR
jgi:hypothetical protein